MWLLTTFLALANAGELAHSTAEYGKAPGATLTVTTTGIAFGDADIPVDMVEGDHGARVADSELRGQLIRDLYDVLEEVHAAGSERGRLRRGRTHDFCVSQAEGRRDRDRDLPVRVQAG